jgi:phage tail sheath protein FI
MASYLAPGVYIEEVSSGSKPIAGVGTSTAAFVGIAEKGVIGKAVLITNWAQFVREFGSFTPNGYLAYAVFGFFAEGGTSCWVVRTCCYKNLNPIAIAAKSASVTLDDSDATPGKSMKVTATSEGKWAEDFSIAIEAATEAGKFKLLVNYQNAKMSAAQTVESYDNLTMTNVEETINGASTVITVETDAWDSITGSKKNPKVIAKASLAGGDDGLSFTDGTTTTNLRYTDFVGDASAKNGLYAFDVVDTISLVAIPDKAGDSDVISGGLTYCSARKDCFFIADGPMADQTTIQLKEFKKNFNNSYGALYYPWVYVADPLTGGKKYVPPSGVVAGTYAHTDSTRGVHKAPAGVNEGFLDSVVGVKKLVTKGEQEELNPVGINIIRSLPTGICVWGARTLTSDTEWTYINVRRLFIYLEKSIEIGTQWVVFEPNDMILWGKVKRNLTAFLTRVWRDGALFGSKPEEALFVKVDEENNPPEVRDAGQLIIEVGVAPVKPAEFVIIRISQKTQGK